MFKKSVIRRRREKNVVSEVRNEVKQVEHLFKDCYKHDVNAFEILKKYVLEKLDKHVFFPLERGDIQRKLENEEYGSIKALMRFGHDLEYHDCDQSISIRIGQAIEEAIKIYIKKEFNIRLDDEGLALDVDRWFEKNTRIDILGALGSYGHGWELKCNVNLDSEKAPAVTKRIKGTREVLKGKFGERVFSGLVCLTAPTSNEIKTSVNSEYIYGYQEFFNAFGVFFRHSEWCKLFDFIVKKAEKAFKFYQNGGFLSNYL